MCVVMYKGSDIHLFIIRPSFVQHSFIQSFRLLFIRSFVHSFCTYNPYENGDEQGICVEGEPLAERPAPVEGGMADGEGIGDDQCLGAKGEGAHATV